MASSSRLGDLNLEESAQLRAVIQRFEAAWDEAEGEGPALSSFLPLGDASMRTMALRELIKTDIDKQWQRGDKPLVERYLARFPELHALPDAVPILLKEEFLIRKERGDAVTLEMYRDRFPQHFEEFENLLRQEQNQGTARLSIGPSLLQVAAHPPGPSSTLGTFAGYKQLEKLGEGTFGEVWRGEAPGGIEVAIKIIKRPLSHVEARRELESLELIKNLRHPYLVQTHTFWPQDDRLYIAMELADGSLRDRLRACSKAGLTGIPAEELLGYMDQSAKALDWLHSKGLMHRDIKPENILTMQGIAKLADFGLARKLPGEFSITGTAAGTPAYMAPEIWRGKPGKEASDLYSLAATYVELRLNRGLFPSKDQRDFVQTMLNHAQETPKLAPLPEAEQQVLLKALAKQAEERYRSCTEFVRALHIAAGTPNYSTQPRLPGGETQPGVITGNWPPGGPEISASIEVPWIGERPPGSGSNATLQTQVPTPQIGELPRPGTLAGTASPTLRPNQPRSADDITEVTPGLVEDEDVGTRRPVLKIALIAAVIGLIAGTATVVMKSSGDTESMWPSIAIQVPDSSGDLRNAFGMGAGSIALMPPLKEEQVVAFRPEGYVKSQDVATKIVLLQDGRRVYNRIERVLTGNLRVEFLLIGEKEAQPFYIMKHKVTNGVFAEYARFAKLPADHPWTLGANFIGLDLGIAGMYVDYPVFRVSMDEAHTCAVWLGGQLPTARQWDRAGGFSGDKSAGPYKPGAEKWNEKANPKGFALSHVGPMRVGDANLDESPTGCRDMASNGYEWYRTVSRKPPEGIEEGLDASLPPEGNVWICTRGMSYEEASPFTFDRTLDFNFQRLDDKRMPKYYATVSFRVVVEIPPK